MNRTSEFLVQAGHELGIQVIAPFELILPSGKMIVVEALLPQLGAPKGMLVVNDYRKIDEVVGEVSKLGYGYSSYGDPSPTDIFDLQLYKEMFWEWGWSSEAGEKPEWMKYGIFYPGEDVRVVTTAPEELLPGQSGSISWMRKKDGNNLYLVWFFTGEKREIPESLLEMET